MNSPTLFSLDPSLLVLLTKGLVYISFFIFISSLVLLLKELLTKKPEKPKGDTKTPPPAANSDATSASQQK